MGMDLLCVAPVRRRGAFTILELLAVIATIAILIGLIWPNFNRVKRSMHLAQSRVQLSRYAGGMRDYFNEYGALPRLLSESEELPSEKVIALDAAISANLIRALSGKELDGITALRDEHAYLNPNGTTFIEFGDDDFWVSKNDKTIDRTRLADRFNNPEIYFVIESDMDDDVLIPQNIFSSYRSIQKKVPPEGLREKVIFFTVGDNNHSLDAISWRSE